MAPTGNSAGPAERIAELLARSGSGRRGMERQALRTGTEPRGGRDARVEAGRSGPERASAPTVDAGRSDSLVVSAGVSAALRQDVVQDALLLLTEVDADNTENTTGNNIENKADNAETTTDNNTENKTGNNTENTADNNIENTLSGQCSGQRFTGRCGRTPPGKRI